MTWRMAWDEGSPRADFSRCTDAVFIGERPDGDAHHVIFAELHAPRAGPPVVERSRRSLCFTTFLGYAWPRIRYPRRIGAASRLRAAGRWKTSCARKLEHHLGADI